MLRGHVTYRNLSTCARTNLPVASLYPVPYSWHARLRTWLLLLLLVGCSLGATSHTYLPDHKRTPGAINPKVTQENLHATVCVSGWSRTVRPPATYTNRLKAKQMRELGLPGSAHDYDEDHLVPLCAGGHPTDPHNLWPQPLMGKWTDKVKDQLESSVCRQVCRGDITLKQGQAIFLDEPDWTKAYLKYFPERG